MAVIQMNYDYWPLLFITFTGPPTVDDVRRYLLRSEVHLEKKEPYAIVYNTNTYEGMSSAVRAEFSSWLKDKQEVLRLYCAGQAYILSSLIQRMILRSIFMVHPPSFPNKIVSNEMQAIAFGFECLKKRQVSLPQKTLNLLGKL